MHTSIAVEKLICFSSGTGIFRAISEKMHAHSLKKDESSLVHLVLGWNGRKNMEMGVEINSKVHWQPSTSLMSNIDCIYKRLRKKDGRSRPKARIQCAASSQVRS